MHPEAAILRRTRVWCSVGSFGFFAFIHYTPTEITIASVIDMISDEPHQVTRRGPYAFLVSRRDLSAGKVGRFDRHDLLAVPPDSYGPMIRR
jgi:hypothetical protein